MDSTRDELPAQCSGSHSSSKSDLMYMCCDSTGLQKLCMPPHTHAALALSDTLMVMMQHTLYCVPSDAVIPKLLA